MILIWLMKMNSCATNNFKIYIILQGRLRSIFQHIKAHLNLTPINFWVVKSYDVPQITASPVSIFDMEFNNQLWSQHFQRNIVRGVEGFISVSSKQMELGSGFSHILCLFPFSTLVYEILSSIVQWESWPGIVANMEMQMKPFILPLLELLLTLVTRINRYKRREKLYLRSLVIR